MIYYQINWGDTIESIAFKFKVKPNIIIEANKDFNFYIGNIIIIPNNEPNEIASTNEIKKGLLYYLRKYFIKVKKSQF